MDLERAGPAGPKAQADFGTSPEGEGLSRSFDVLL